MDREKRVHPNGRRHLPCISGWHKQREILIQLKKKKKPKHRQQTWIVAGQTLKPLKD